MHVYAYVDSINCSITYSNVQESSEANKLDDPVVSITGTGTSSGYEGWEIPTAALPKR